MGSQKRNPDPNPNPQPRSRPADPPGRLLGHAPRHPYLLQPPSASHRPMPGPVSSYAFFPPLCVGFLEVVSVVRERHDTQRAIEAIKDAVTSFNEAKIERERADGERKKAEDERRRRSVEAMVCSYLSRWRVLSSPQMVRSLYAERMPRHGP